LKILLAFVAMLGLSYIMADKTQIPAERARVNRWARPLFLFALGLAALIYIT
jgi:hypothetical protein